MSKNFVFTSMVGSFILDEKLDIVSKGQEKSLAGKHDAVPLPKDKIKDFPGMLKRSDYFSDFRNRNIELTKDQIRKSATQDLLIVQAIETIDDVNVTINTLSKRFREWFELYCPEFSRAVQDHARFVELVSQKSRNDLLSDIGIRPDLTMGGQFGQEDIDAMMQFAKHLKELQSLKTEEEKYVEKAMKKICPNVTAIAGSLLGAKLLSHAGSLEKFSEMPSSTIQLLGAEKALFRHRKTGARPPKHGVIVQHNYFTKIKSKDYGKLARMLADKISIAAKVDFFRGEFIGEKLRIQIENRLEGYG